MRVRKSSQYLESLFVAGCVIHCTLMAGQNGQEFLSGATYFQRILIYSPLLSFATFMYLMRGFRMHVLPAVLGFASYAFALLFLVFEETTYYFYVVTSMVSAVLLVFFGSQNFYASFIHQNASYQQVGVHTTALPKEEGGSLVVVYYPCEATTPSNYPDLKWAADGSGLLKGIYKFFYGYLPKLLFKSLLEARLGVYQGAPLHPLKEETEKYPVAVFSHGVGQNATFFSTICKDLATQGFVVYALEHRDYSALHFRGSTGKLKVFKDFEMRDFNTINLKQEIRARELKALLNNLPALVEQVGGWDSSAVDYSEVTTIGHGFGGVSAYNLAASCPDKVRTLISLDPWLYCVPTPSTLPMPHLSIVSEYFQSSKIQGDTTIWGHTSQALSLGRERNMLAILQDCSHMVFSDLALMMPFEFWMLTWVPSLDQLFRSQYNVTLTLQVMRAFLIREGVLTRVKGAGALNAKEAKQHSDQIIAKIQATKDVDFDIL